MNAALLLAASALVAGLPAPSAGLLSNPQQHWGFDGPELGDTCTPTIIGANMDVQAHDLKNDLLQLMEGIADLRDCAAACCADSRCSVALFERISARTVGGCMTGMPCCFLKTSVAGFGAVLMPDPGVVINGGSTLIEIPSRKMKDRRQAGLGQPRARLLPRPQEKLTFLSSILGSHMVLQQAPQSAVVWGFTTPGATVHTAMVSPTKSETFVATAGTDGTWRLQLPPIPASKTPYHFIFASENQTARMDDVLFGEVFICGGQSNMVFAMPFVANASTERQLANDFPTIRTLSVGRNTQSSGQLRNRNLQAVWEPWQVASNTTISNDRTTFPTFSAVCWLFGRHISTELSANGDVPVGLVSNNFGGTKVEDWVPSTAYDSCQRTGLAGRAYNAMILPFAEGPMVLAGFAWYQGEANTANTTTAAQYGCLFPEMIRAWRAAFAAPGAFFGFIQLSTWCTSTVESVPQMRAAQMLAASLSNVGWATNADHGAGCDIHPPPKQAVSKRLANAALALRYDKPVAWKSPTYKASVQLATATNLTIWTANPTANPTSSEPTANPTGTRSEISGAVSLEVAFDDVGADGLELIFPFNYHNGSTRDGVNTSVPVNCSAAATYPCGPDGAESCSMAGQCAWAELEVAGEGWVNATVAVSSDGQGLVLTAGLPASSAGADRLVIGSSYGWGPIPMMTAYDRASGLPVLPWKATWNTTATPPTASPTTSPATSVPTTVTLSPTTAPTPPLAMSDHCPDGYYGSRKLRFNWGLGRITVVRSHAECADRCQKFSSEQFDGGCKAYMTGMYYGMLLCRSYGGRYMTSTCPPWAVPTSPGFVSGALGSTHWRTGQPNVGGNCCVNATFRAGSA